MQTLFIRRIQSESGRRCAWFGVYAQEIMKERKNHRSMKKGVRKAKEEGVDIAETLNKCGSCSVLKS